MTRPTGGAPAEGMLRASQARGPRKTGMSTRADTTATVTHPPARLGPWQRAWPMAEARKRRAERQVVQAMSWEGGRVVRPPHDIPPRAFCRPLFALPGDGSSRTRTAAGGRTAQEQQLPFTENADRIWRGSENEVKLSEGPLTDTRESCPRRRITAVHWTRLGAPPAWMHSRTKARLPHRVEARRGNRLKPCAIPWGRPRDGALA